MQEKTLTGGRSYYLDIARAIAIISISLNHAVRAWQRYSAIWVCGAFLRSAAVKVTALSPGKAKETTWHCPPFVVKYHGI